VPIDSIYREVTLDILSKYPILVGKWCSKQTNIWQEIVCI
jgi:hypothetical protein